MCVFLCCPGPHHCGRCVCVHEYDLSLGIASAGSHEEQIDGDCSPSWQAPARASPLSLTLKHSRRGQQRQLCVKLGSRLCGRSNAGPEAGLKSGDI